MSGRHIMTPLYAFSIDMDDATWRERDTALTADGYRLVLLDRFRRGSTIIRSAIWRRDESPVATRAVTGKTLSGFRDALTTLDTEGFRLRQFTTDGVGFDAVWEEGSNLGFRTRLDMDRHEYQAEYEAQAAAGMRLEQVVGWADGPTSRYGARWTRHDPDPRRARHNLPIADYPATAAALEAEGYSPLHLQLHAAGTGTIVSGAWVKRDGYAPVARHDMTPALVEALAASHAEADRAPTCVSGYRHDNNDRYAAIWVPQSRRWLVQGQAVDAVGSRFDAPIREHMQQFAVPGASLAMTHRGKVVLARGYSWITDAESPVSPTSLFRIGSLTKAHTAAAILHLIEQDRLALGDRLVDLIDMPEPIADSRLRSVTIEHLLHHSGGWDRDSSGDPMRMDATIAEALNVPLPVTRHAIVRWANQQRLDFTPGTRYAYSNYGYMLLGLVIDAVTGEHHAEYIREHIHRPLGIHRMRPARTALRDRAQDEVLHHGALYSPATSTRGEGLVLRQYGGYRNYENTSSGGGWLAAAVDIVRFASAFDDPNACPILNRASVDLMFAPPAYGAMAAGSANYYGCGWFVDPVGANIGATHGGTTEGSKSFMARWNGPDGPRTIALLFNKTETDTWDMVALTRTIADQVRLPFVATDLWPQFA